MTDTQAHAPSNISVFALAWPLGLKAVMIHGIIVIDAYLVSPLGEAAIAAMGLAGAVAGLLLGILFSFSTATQIRIAQAFGASGPKALKTGFYCGLVINLIATAVGIGIVVLFGDDIITAFAHTPWIAAQAQAYLNVFLIVVLAEAVGQCLSSHFNGCGKTRLPFYSYLIALPINVIISAALIHGFWILPELGVVGAAIGTATASLARASFMGVAFYIQDRGFRDVSGWSKETFKASLFRHFVFSLPIAGTFISVTAGNQVCTLIYAKLSVNHFAALTLMLPWVQVVGTVGMAWAQATGIMVAQLLGKGLRGAELDQFLSRVWRIAFVAAAIVATIYLVLCLSMVWIYDGLEQDTITALLTFLPVLLLLPFPKGSNAICGQTLRASGDTVRVMNIFIAAQWLFKVPMTALFVLYWDMPVVWVFALVFFEELVKFPPFHLRLYSGAWKNPKNFAD